MRHLGSDAERWSLGKQILSERGGEGEGGEVFPCPRKVERPVNWSAVMRKFTIWNVQKLRGRPAIEGEPGSKFRESDLERNTWTLNEKGVEIHLIPREVGSRQRGESTGGGMSASRGCQLRTNSTSQQTKIGRFLLAKLAAAKFRQLQICTKLAELDRRYKFSLGLSRNKLQARYGV